MKDETSVSSVATSCRNVTLPDGTCYEITETEDRFSIVIKGMTSERFVPLIWFSTLLDTVRFAVRRNGESHFMTLIRLSDLSVRIEGLDETQRYSLRVEVSRHRDTGNKGERPLCFSEQACKQLSHILGVTLHWGGPRDAAEASAA